MCCHQRVSDVGSGVRKWRPEAYALNFLSEGLIVVCQWGRWSFLIFDSPSLSPDPSFFFYRYIVDMWFISTPSGHHIVGDRYRKLKGRGRTADRNSNACGPTWLNITAAFSQLIKHHHSVRGGERGGSYPLRWSHICKHWDRLPLKMESRFDIPK